METAGWRKYAFKCPICKGKVSPHPNPTFAFKIQVKCITELLTPGPGAANTLTFPWAPCILLGCPSPLTLAFASGLGRGAGGSQMCCMLESKSVPCVVCTVVCRPLAKALRHLRGGAGGPSACRPVHQRSEITS